MNTFYKKKYIKKVILFLLLCIPILGFGQIVIESTTSGQSTGSSLTFQHNRGTASNTLTLVSLQLGRQTTVSGNVTYGGQAMTFVGSSSRSSGSGLRTTVLIYQIFNAPTGNQNVSINVSFTDDTNGIVAGAMSFSNVEPTSPLRAYVGNDGDSSTSSITNIPTGPGEIVFSAISHASNTTVNHGTGQVERWRRISNTNSDRAKGKATTKAIASGATTSVSYSNHNGRWAAGAVSIRPSLCNLSADISATPTSCSGADNGEITVTNPSGATNFEYRLDNGAWQASPNFTGLAPNTYAVSIRDADNTSCEEVLGNVTVDSGPELSATVNLTQASCSNPDTGDIAISNLSGADAYEFRINGGAWQTSPNFVGLSLGTYTVEIRDANNTGCTVNLGSFELTDAALLSADVGVQSATCGLKTGAINISNADGATSFEYRIDTNDWQSSPNFTNLEEGSYTVFIRDAAIPTCEESLGSFEIECEPLKQNLVIGKLTIDGDALLDFGSEVRGMVINPVVNTTTMDASIGTIAFDGASGSFRFFDSRGWSPVISGGETGGAESGNDVFQHLVGAESSTTKGVMIFGEDEGETNALILPRLANGNLRFKNPVTGLIYYDTVLKAVMVYNGNGWTKF